MFFISSIIVFPPISFLWANFLILFSCVVTHVPDSYIYAGTATYNFISVGISFFVKFGFRSAKKSKGLLLFFPLSLPLILFPELLLHFTYSTYSPFNLIVHLDSFLPFATSIASHLVDFYIYFLHANFILYKDSLPSESFRLLLLRTFPFSNIQFRTLFLLLHILWVHPEAANIL